MEKKQNIEPLDENGLKHGLCAYYWPNVNGEICSKSFYKHGKLNGIRVTYRNGFVRFKYMFKMGVLDGLFIEYAGPYIVERTMYKNGKKHGINEYYDENGLLTSKRTFKMNKHYGLWTYWTDKKINFKRFYL